MTPLYFLRLKYSIGKTEITQDKTICRDLTEILLKVALNTIKRTYNVFL